MKKWSWWFLGSLRRAEDCQVPWRQFILNTARVVATYAPVQCMFLNIHATWWDGLLCTEHTMGALKCLVPKIHKSLKLFPKCFHWYHLPAPCLSSFHHHSAPPLKKNCTTVLQSHRPLAVACLPPAGSGSGGQLVANWPSASHSPSTINVLCGTFTAPNPGTRALHQCWGSSWFGSWSLLYHLSFQDLIFISNKNLEPEP